MVKGYFQGIVDNTYAPVVDFTAVRVALAIAVKEGMVIHQLDIRTDFLHGTIGGVVHVSPPPGLTEVGVTLCSEGQTLRLQKELYGLKQAPKWWHFENGKLS